MSFFLQMFGAVAYPGENFAGEGKNIRVPHDFFANFSPKSSWPLPYVVFPKHFLLNSRSFCQQTAIFSKIAVLMLKMLIKSRFLMEIFYKFDIFDKIIRETIRFFESRVIILQIFI